MYIFVDGDEREGEGQIGGEGKGKAGEIEARYTRLSLLQRIPAFEHVRRILIQAT